MSTESSYYLEEPSNTSFEETTMKNTFTYKKYNCNIHRCRYCHPEKRNLTKKELEAIRKKVKEKQAKNFKSKYCYENCSYCQKHCEAWEAWVISVSLETKSTPNTEHNPPKIEESEKEISNKREKSNFNIKDYEVIRVRHDGNCAVRAILTDMGINEDHYGTLRKYIADKLETYDFQKEEMDMLQCSKEEFIQEIRTDRKFVGQEILSYISKLLNINLIIYLADDRYKDNPIVDTSWEGVTQNRPTYYLHLRQGNYMDRDIDGEFNALRKKKKFRCHQKQTKTYSD